MRWNEKKNIEKLAVEKKKTSAVAKKLTKI